MDITYIPMARGFVYLTAVAETLRASMQSLASKSPGGITGPQLTFRKCVMRVSMSCIVWSLSGGVVRGCRDL